MKSSTIVLVALLPLVLAVGLTAFILWYGDAHHKIDITEASTLMTASAVILTGTAVIIALISLFGFEYIRKRAEEVARRTAEKTAREVAASAASRVVYDMMEQSGIGQNADETARAASKEP